MKSIVHRPGTHRVLSFALLAALGIVLMGCPSAQRPRLVVFVQGLSPEEIEARHPLTDEARAELTPENVATLAQWEVDQLYARLDPGPIPDGPWQGRFFFAKGGGPSRLSEAIGGLTGRLVDWKLARLDRVGEALWKGKFFFRDEGVLRNMIDHERVLEELFDAVPGSVRKQQIGGRTVALLFPAKLYCGESLYDTRRESVIIDYAETDTVEGYVPEIDYLAGSDGLLIRDEVRYVRPGFYLGRAYAKGKLLLTFTLYNEEAAAAGEGAGEECWDGRTARAEPQPMDEAPEEDPDDGGEESGTPRDQKHREEA
jgi:hypothetical protein